MLISALRKAHTILGETRDGLPRLESAPANPYSRKLLRLAFLSPGLQAAILVGTQPEGLTLDQLVGTSPPLLWRDQSFDSPIP